MKNLKFAALGIIFGTILVKSEIISWFRIQEMFRFQSYNMYALMGSAIAVGMASILLIKKRNIKTIDGEQITIDDKKFNKGNIIGGLLFGLGWGLTGACPGPMFALMGSGVLAFAVVFISAVLGTYVYGVFRERLPH